MKISDVEAIHLRLPDVEEVADGTQDVLVVLIHTDEGVTGIGEVTSQSYVAKAVFEAPRSAEGRDWESSSTRTFLTATEYATTDRRFYCRRYVHSDEATWP